MVNLPQPVCLNKLCIVNEVYIKSNVCISHWFSIVFIGDLQTVGEYLQSSIHSMIRYTFNICKLDANCTSTMDVHNIQTDIKVAIVEIL